MTSKLSKTVSTILIRILDQYLLNPKISLWENEIENRKSKIDNRKSKVENRMKILSQSVSQISTTNLSQNCFYLLYNYDTTTATRVTALYKNQESVPFFRRLQPKT